MKKLLILFFFLASPVWGATVWVNPSGTHTEPYGSKAAGAANLQAAMAYASGGDTIMISDGTYTGNSNMITGLLMPPAGDSWVTGHYTIIKAETDGGVTFDGEGAREMFQCGVGGLNPTHIAKYWQFEGIVWGRSRDQFSALGFIHLSHVKFLRCGMWEGGNFTYDGIVMAERSSYILFEDCYAWGRGRYAFATYAGDVESGNSGNDGYGTSHHIIFRRCVARIDRYGPSTPNPMEVFCFYTSSDCLAQNCIAIDCDQTYTMGNNDVQTFAIPTTAGDSNYVKFEGCIGLNNKTGGISASTFNAYQAYNSSFENMALWNTSLTDPEANANFLWGSGTTVDHCTFGTFSGYGGGGFTNGFTGEHGIASGSVVQNSIIYNFTGTNLFYVVGSEDYNDLHDNTVTNVRVTTSAGAHDSTADPIWTVSNTSGGMKYLPRVESGSTQYTAGSDSSVQGAVVMTKIGTSGTLHGDTGYDTDTGLDLWPFPNESLIKTKMQAYSVGGVSGDRGFASSSDKQLDGTSDVTLTSYIWEYLGNQMPADIYGEAPAPPTLSNVTISGGSFR